MDISLYLFGLVWGQIDLLIQALPTQTPPSTAPTDGDWIGLIEGYIKDGATLMGFSDLNDRFSLGFLHRLRQVQRGSSRTSRMG